MIAAARRIDGRLAEHDALLIMVAYRHGLRASELIALRWDQIDLKAGTLHVARLKHGRLPRIHYAARSFEPWERGSESKPTWRPMCSPRCGAAR